MIHSSTQFKEMEWIKRHKNKLIFTAVAVTGVYGVGRFIVGRVKDSQSYQNTDFIDTTRLLEHCHSNHETTVSAVVGVLPSVRDVVCSQLDSDSVMAQLKTKPANKVSLWEDLKILSKLYSHIDCFSRVVTGVYASSLLAVFMSVQLSVLGGVMYKDLHTEHSSPTDGQKQYLAMIEHLLHEGVVNLCEVVRQSCVTVLAGYSLKQQLTCEGLDQLVTDIRAEVTSSSPHRSGKSRSFLLQYVIPKERLLQKSTPRDDLDNAIRDILESHQFSQVLEACLERAFSTLANSLTQTYHSATQSQSTLPLARVIPMVTDHTQFVFAPQSTGIVQSILEQKNLITLSQNIYESFSQS